VASFVVPIPIISRVFYGAFFAINKYVMIFEKIPKMVSIRGSEMAIFVKKEPLTHKTHTPSHTANVPKYPINRIID